MPIRIPWEKVKFSDGDQHCTNPIYGNMSFMPKYIVGDTVDPSEFHRKPDINRPDIDSTPDNTTAQELREHIEALSPEIDSIQTKLKLIVERHDARISKRWRKKNKAQKIAILEGAWGGPLAVQHNEHFKKFTCGKNDVPDESWYEAFMWPYVNKDDLTQTEILPMFLHSRAYGDPVSFADSDLHAMNLGRLVKLIKPIYLDGHAVCFRRGAKVAPYAVLINQDHETHVDHCLYDYSYYTPGDGILILEAQVRLLSFLKDCALAILSDIPNEQLYEGPKQTKLYYAYTDCSVAAVLAISPYRIPDEINYAEVVALIAAKKDACAEHLLALRDDPAYFSQIAKETWEEKKLLGLTQGHCPQCHSNNEEVIWGEIFGEVISTALTDVEIWSTLHDQSRGYHEMLGIGRIDSRQIQTELHKIFEKSLVIRYSLSMFCELMRTQLEKSIVLLPTYKHFQQAWSMGAGGGGRKLPTKRSSPASRTEREELFFLLTLLSPHNPWLLWLGTNTVMDEIQRSLQSSSTARDAIGIHINSVVSDISIIIICLQQASIGPPWFMLSAAVDKYFRSKIHEDMLAKCKALDLIREEIYSQCHEHLGPLGNPNKVDFRYPVNKRHNRETVEMMRTAEANLRNFWATVERTCLKEIFKQNKAVEKVYLEPPSLPATPEWVEPCKAQTQSTSSRPEEICKPLSEIYLDLQQRTESTLIADKPATDVRTKIKSRGLAITSTSIIDKSDHETASEERTPEIFEVNNRVHKVFKTLFFTASPTATPGEIDWAEFLHAMTSVGFQTKKLHGSMWQFSPSKKGLRNIIFHEPHPSSKIPYHSARRHGRRLTKVYGWTGENFKLIKKAG